MASKREIHAFDQAVVLLMASLDFVFAHRVSGWKRGRKGFSVKINYEKTERNFREVSCTITPVGAPPEDYVGCRFEQQGREWVAYKGQISFQHSAEEVRGLPFKWDPFSAEEPLEDRHPAMPIKKILAQDPSLRVGCDNY